MRAELQNFLDAALRLGAAFIGALVLCASAMPLDRPSTWPRLLPTGQARLLRRRVNSIAASVLMTRALGVTLLGSSAERVGAVLVIHAPVIALTVTMLALTAALLLLTGAAAIWIAFVHIVHGLVD